MQFSPDNILLYSSAEYILNKDEYLKIQNRIAVYQSETKTKSAVWPILITVFGVAGGEYANAINQQITITDLMWKKHFAIFDKSIIFVQ